MLYPPRPQQLHFCCLVPVSLNSPIYYVFLHRYKAQRDTIWLKQIGVLHAPASVSGSIDSWMHNFLFKSYASGMPSGEWNNRGRTGSPPELAGAVAAEQQPCSEPGSRSAQNPAQEWWWWQSLAGHSPEQSPQLLWPREREGVRKGSSTTRLCSGTRERLLLLSLFRNHVGFKEHLCVSTQCRGCHSLCCSSLLSTALPYLHRGLQVCSSHKKE